MLDGLQSKDVEDCTPSQLHSQVSSQGVGQRSQSSQASSRAARSQQQLQGVQESTIQCSADECLDLLSSEAAIDDEGHHWRSIYSAVAKCPFYYCVETGIGQFVRPPSLTLIPRKNAGHAATAGIRVSQVLNGSMKMGKAAAIEEHLEANASSVSISAMSMTATLIAMKTTLPVKLLMMLKMMMTTTMKTSPPILNVNRPPKAHPRNHPQQLPGPLIAL
jgi:hypothetical protein